MTSCRTFHRLCIAGLILAVVSFEPAIAQGDIIFSTTTDKQQYFIGEPLNVLVTAENTGDQPVTLGFSSGLQADYLMDDVDLWSSHRFFIQAVTGQTVPANGSFTWTLPHAWQYYSPAPGMHSVVGRIRTEVTAPAHFTILAVPSPTSPSSPLPEPAAPLVGSFLFALTIVQRRR